MRTMLKVLSMTVVGLALCWAGQVGAAPGGTPGQNTLAVCTANLNATIANLTTCTANLTTETGLYNTCTTNLTSETGLYNTCTTDLNTCNAGLGTCTTNLNTANTNLATCTTDLNACNEALAAAQQFPATGQTTSYAPGDDGNIRAGAALSYTDNPNGTITDNNTGLVWEKKTDCAGATHCVNNSYAWQGALDYVAALNTANFAGHNDWRLPNVKELQSIVNYGNVNPAVSLAFNDCVNGSCTAASYYWSSSSIPIPPAFAWVVNFGDGFVVANFERLFAFFVRAVRGGS